MENRNYEVTIPLKTYNELYGTKMEYKRIIRALEDVYKNSRLSWNHKFLSFDDEDIYKFVETVDEGMYEIKLKELQEKENGE